MGLIRGGELCGSLRVRAPALVLRVHLPAWLARLARAHPGIEVDLADIGDGDVSLLLDGDADVFIDTLERIPPDVEAMSIDTLRPFVVIPASHPLARARRRALADLAGTPFVAYGSDRRARALQLEALTRHGVEARRLVGAGSSDTILGLVAAGLGFSLVPAVRTGPDHPGVVAWPLPPPTAEFPVLAAWRRSSAENPLLAAFLAMAPGRPRGAGEAGPGSPAGSRPGDLPSRPGRALPKKGS